MVDRVWNRYYRGYEMVNVGYKMANSGTKWQMYEIVKVRNDLTQWRYKDLFSSFLQPLKCANSNNSRGNWSKSEVV